MSDLMRPVVSICQYKKETILPISVDKKLKHFQNKYEELSNKKEVISELLLKLSLKLAKSIIILEQEIEGVVREIRNLEEVEK